MLKFLRKTKFFIFFLIFINVSSSLIGLEQTGFTVKPKSSFEKGKDIMEQLYNEDGLLMYDAIMNLLEEIENGALEDICTDEDWYKINHFIAYLARLGSEPYATDEEKAELEKDIQELLNIHEDDIKFENISYNTSDYQIIPAIYHDQNDFILCKNWIKKQCRHTKKFVKKHKTVSIIGGGMIVGGIVTFGIITLLTPTATAAAVAALKSTTPKFNPNTKGKSTLEDSSVTEPNLAPENSLSSKPDIALDNSFENTISPYKNTIVENNLLSPESKNANLKEKERIIGSTLAHEALSNIGKSIQVENHEGLIAQVHGKIDNAFARSEIICIDSTKLE